MSDLLQVARSLGVQMGSVVQGVRVGWTANEGKAERLREAGARVVSVCSGDLPAMAAGDDPRRVIGYEISILTIPAAADG